MEFDVIVVGGSYAGISAATYIARGRNSVCVVDDAIPRNRSSAGLHGMFGWDGDSPVDIVKRARAQLEGYDEVTWVAGRAEHARAEAGGFVVTLASGDEIAGAKILLAFGVTDDLPELAGLAARWGQSVLHCPYCHGYEYSDQLLGVLGMGGASSQQAAMIANWGPTTYFLHGVDLDEISRKQLHERGVTIEPVPVRRLTGDGTALSSLELVDGRSIPLTALFVMPSTRPGSQIAEQLGCSFDAGMFGPTIAVDEGMMTNVTGVYAAGDVMRTFASATFATSDGVAAGVSISRALIMGA